MFGNLGKNKDQIRFEKEIYADIKAEDARAAAQAARVEAKKNETQLIDRIIATERDGDTVGMETALKGLEAIKLTEREANAAEIALITGAQQASVGKLYQATTEALKAQALLGGGQADLKQAITDRVDVRVGRKVQQAVGKQQQALISDASQVNVGAGGLSREELMSLVEARKEVLRQSSDKRLDSIMERLDATESTVERKQ